MDKRSNSGEDFNSIVLCNKGNVTIEKYLKWKDAEKKEEIANFIYDRFSERYIAPLDKESTSGFCILANCCLMIESFESFYNGWKDTKGKIKKRSRSELAFDSFFNRVESFRELHSFSSEFWKCVRCGILHQAETTGGWRIWRGKYDFLFDRDGLIVNATKFLNLLKGYLGQYKKDLINAEWEADIWRNLVTKMESIISNCKRS